MLRPPTDSFSHDCEAVLTAGDGAGVGKVFHYFTGKFSFHQRVYMLNTFRHVSGRYIYFHLRENFGRVALDGNAKSTVDSLRMPVFLNFAVPVPPIGEQQEILDWINKTEIDIDCLVEKSRRNIELMSEHRTALVSAAVTRRLNEAQMNEVHKRYCEDFKMSLRFDHIEKALIDADLLINLDGLYSFKYKYCYYYFAAKHLMDRLSTDTGKAQLRRLAEHVYKEEFANILVFLAYLSREPIIVEEMLRASRAVYPDVEPCDFGDQMNFVSDLHDKVTKTVMIEKDAKSARKEINQTIDHIEAQMPQPAEDVDLNDALRINVAFKTIQILGQILKNHPGSIKGPVKMEIAEECYFLGLRSLRALLNVLAPHRDGIVEFISQQLERFEEDADERSKKARKFVSLLIEGIALAFIKKISGSVGTAALRQTYDELVAKHDRLAVKLIDLSVKLDHFERFPSDEFDHLIENAVKHNDLFATLLLRHLAFDHFYRYTIPRAIKQRYCDKLGIELKTVNLLEYKQATS